MLYFLIGLPGCGKSYWGKILAERYNIPFVDLDSVIEETHERSIREIFQNEGEAYFRKLESQVLQKLIQENESGIIACGGGTPCFHDNMERMNASGITIFLNTATEMISKKLENGQEIQKRPLFKGAKSLTEVKAILDELLSTRMQYYKKARHEIIPGSFNNAIKQFNKIFGT